MSYVVFVAYEGQKDKEGMLHIQLCWLHKYQLQTWKTGFVVKIVIIIIRSALHKLPENHRYNSGSFFKNKLQLVLVIKLILL